VLRPRTGRPLLPLIPIPLRLVHHRKVHFHIVGVRDVYVLVITIGRRITGWCFTAGVGGSAGKIGLRHVLAEFASRAERWLRGRYAAEWQMMRRCCFLGLIPMELCVQVVVVIWGVHVSARWEAAGVGEQDNLIV
jgi:hypothetical protein